jgi:hypothetical protein
VKTHYGKTIVNENITKRTLKEEKMEALDGVHVWEGKKLC